MNFSLFPCGRSPVSRSAALPAVVLPALVLGSLLLLGGCAGSAKEKAPAEVKPRSATASQCFPSKKECEKTRLAVEKSGTMPKNFTLDKLLPGTGSDTGTMVNDTAQFRWSTSNVQCEELVQSFPAEAPPGAKGSKKKGVNALFCFQAKGEAIETK